MTVQEWYLHFAKHRRTWTKRLLVFHYLRQETQKDDARGTWTYAKQRSLGSALSHREGVDGMSRSSTLAIAEEWESYCVP